MGKCGKVGKFEPVFFSCTRWFHLGGRSYSSVFLSIHPDDDDGGDGGDDHLDDDDGDDDDDHPDDYGGWWSKCWAISSTRLLI